MRTLIIGLAAALLAPAVAAAQADIQLGKHTYAAHCAACHGPTGDGGAGPSLIDPTWKHGADPLSVAESIRNGRPPGMPGFSGVLTEPQINGVAAFLKSKAIPTTAVRQALSGAPGPTGLPKGVVKSALHDFRVEGVARVEKPYAFAFLPDGRILITETAGRLRVVENGRLLPDPVADAPAGDITGMKQVTKRALLSVAVHPRYAENGWIYLLTVRAARTPTPQSPMVATITRGRLRDGRWTDSQALISFPTVKTNSLRMKFDAQGFLYVGVPWSDIDYLGTGEDTPAQNLASPQGKILRMTDDGRVPGDNPFAGRANAYPYVFSYGHREPSGLTFDGNGELWSVEDGPRGGDELNHIRAGRNYGWPVITWGHRYDSRASSSATERDGMEQPVVSWVPAPALSDVEWYGGRAFPRWTDSFFVGSMKQRDLFRVVVDGDRQVLVETVLHNMDRIRDIATGPDGFIYLLTDAGDLARMVPAAP